MSEPNSDFTNERPRREDDITGQPARPAYDYEPDGDDKPRPSLRKAGGVSFAGTIGCVVVGLLAGFSAMVIFVMVVCSR